MKGEIKMENLEFNKKYTVRDKMLNHGVLFHITLEASKVFKDFFVVYDEYFDEHYYMSKEDLFETFEILN